MFARMVINFIIHFVRVFVKTKCDKENNNGAVAIQRNCGRNPEREEGRTKKQRDEKEAV